MTELEKLRKENDRLMAKIMMQFNNIDTMIKKTNETLKEIKKNNERIENEQ